MPDKKITQFNEATSASTQSFLNIVENGQNYKITKENYLDGYISDAPQDGRQYGRQDGDWTVIETQEFNLITESTGFQLSGQTLTVFSGWTWNINEMVYSNPSNVNINIPFAASGLTRIDLIVATTGNTFIRVPGIESVDNPVAPDLPDSTLEATFLTVTDGMIEEPPVPVTSNLYIEKAEKKITRISLSGITNNLNVNGPTKYSFRGNISEIRGFAYSNVASVAKMYTGKEYTFHNLQPSQTPITFKHNHTSGTRKLKCIGDIDYVLRYGESINFILDETNNFTQVGVKNLYNDVTGNTQNILTLQQTVSGLTEFTYFIEGTYAELEILKNSNQLIPEKLYILTDYQHKYYIGESNSDNRKVFHSISSIVSNFAVLDESNTTVDKNVTDLFVGNTVTIESLPPGYTGTLVVGNTTTVASVFSSAYFTFTNGMHQTGSATNPGNTIVGTIISYPRPRFSTLTGLTSTTILDTNSKIIMKPGGLVNTDVHDGTPYGNMTSGTNYNPPIESIILKAKTENSFYEDCTSLTFKNDEMIYDFDDNIIYNDNRENIGTRNGFITRRINKPLNIDINKDWRVQRYRRWRMESGDSMKKLLNTYHSNTNEFLTHQNKYLYTSELYGEASLPYINKALETSSYTAHVSGYTESFNIVITGSTSNFIDYPIFSLDSNLDPVKVNECEILNLNNSVFINNASTSNYNLHLSTRNSITDSTFLAYPKLDDPNIELANVNVFDSVDIKGINNKIQNSNFLSFIAVNTYLSNTTFNTVILGSLPYNVFLSGLGTLPSNTPARWFTMSFHNCSITSSLIGVGIANISLDNVVMSQNSLFHYGGVLTIYNSSGLGKFKSLYSQSYKAYDLTIMPNKTYITELISGSILRSDKNSVVYFQNIDILVPANTVTKYYDQTTKLFVTI